MILRAFLCVYVCENLQPAEQQLQQSRECIPVFFCTFSREPAHLHVYVLHICVCVSEGESFKGGPPPLNPSSCKALSIFFLPPHITPRAVWTPRQLCQPDSAH